MLVNSKPFRLTDFSGGININDPRDSIADTQAYASTDNYDKTKNVYWDSGIKKRSGVLKVNSVEIDGGGADDIINGIRVYRSSAPTKTTIVASNVGTDATRVYYLNGSDNFTQITNGTGWAGFTLNSDVYFAVWKGNVYVTSGTAVIQKITDPTSGDMSDISGNSNYPQYITLHRNRLWVAGGNMTEGQVECSYLSDDTDWASGNGEVFNLGLNDGDPIKQLISLGDDLIIYKNDSIRRITGDSADNWFVREWHKDIGCVASKSVTNTPYGHLFLASDNKIYLFNGQQFRPVSQNIQPWLDNISSGMRDNVAGIWFGNYYYLAISKTGSSYNDVILLLDLRTLGENSPSWWLYDNINVNAFVKYDGPGDTNVLYYCDSDAGFYRQMNTGTADDGTDFTAEYHSKKHTFGQPHIEKAWDRLNVDVASNTGDYTLKLKKGFDDSYEKEYTIATGGSDIQWAASGGATWGSSTWQGDDPSRYSYEDLLSTELDGSHLSFYVKHDTAYQDVKIDSITISGALKSY